MLKTGWLMRAVSVRASRLSVIPVPERSVSEAPADTVGKRLATDWVLRSWLARSDCSAAR